MINNNIVVDYVLMFNDIVRHTIWGSESWQVSVHPTMPSIISNGRLAGMALHNVCPNFKLLAKMIDAKDKLSVQVHLNEHTAKFINGEAKTEMWCMLNDSSIYAGFLPNTNRNDVALAVKNNKLEHLLVKHNAKHNESFFIPGGMVHAIDENSLIYEIQQSSDTTYRIYDWGRVDSNGNPRQLHIDDGLKAINYSLNPPTPNYNIDCNYFSFKQIDIFGEARFPSYDRYVILFAEDADVTVNGEILLRRHSALVPPNVPFSIVAKNAHVFATYSK